MIKYRASKLFSGEIQALEVVKETPKRIRYLEPNFINPEKTHERLEAKESGYHCWFDTWEEARLWLVEKASLRVDSAKSELLRAWKILRRAKGMEKSRPVTWETASACAEARKI